MKNSNVLVKVWAKLVSSVKAYFGNKAEIKNLLIALELGLGLAIAFNCYFGLETIVSNHLFFNKSIDFIEEATNKIVVIYIITTVIVTGISLRLNRVLIESNKLGFKIGYRIYTVLTRIVYLVLTMYNVMEYAHHYDDIFLTDSRTLIFTILSFGFLVLHELVISLRLTVSKELWFGKNN